MSDQILNSIKRATISTLRPYRKEVENIYMMEKNFQFKPLSEIIDYQNKLFKKLLRYAYKTPYYKKIIDDFGKPIEKFSLDDLKYFPVLTKEIIRTSAQDLINKTAKGIYQNSSGGSTGEPINFYQDYNYKIHMNANTWVCNEMAGYYPGCKIAKLWAAPQDKLLVKGLIGKFNLWLTNTIYCDSFNMGHNEMHLFHKRLSKFKPDIIIAFTSSIISFVEFLDQNTLKPDYPKISIITTAEKLTTQMRKKIESVFNVRIFDRYGSRESSAIAAECKYHDGLHIQMTGIIAEVIDPQTKKPVFNKPGEIVITILHNYCMPFIRYKNGDMGILTRERCQCGRNTYRFKEIVGRTIDNFLMPDGKILHGLYFIHMFYGKDGIKRYQFIQEDIDKFTLKIIPDSNFTQEIINDLEKKIRKVIGNQSNLDIIITDTIEKASSGKYRFAISKVDVFKDLQEKNKI